MTSTVPLATAPAPPMPRPSVRRLPEVDCDVPASPGLVPAGPSSRSPGPGPGPGGNGVRRGGGGAPEPTSAEPRLPAHTVVRQLLEVLDGRRPAIQLADLVTEPVLRYLTATAGRLDDRRFGPARVGTRRTGLLRASAAERVAGAGLRSVRVCQPVAGVAELSVVWRYRGRSRALAARFELPRPDRKVPPPASVVRLGLRFAAAGRSGPSATPWRCTVLRVG